MKSRRFTLSIAALIGIVTVFSILLALFTHDWERPTVSQKCHVVLQKQLDPTIATGEWLFEFHNSRIDTFEFETSRKRSVVMRQIESLSISNYELTSDWASENSGYTTARWYAEPNLNATLHIGIKWVPADKRNRVRFVWHKPSPKSAG